MKKRLISSILSATITISIACSTFANYPDTESPYQADETEIEITIRPLFVIETRPVIPK